MESTYLKKFLLRLLLVSLATSALAGIFILLFGKFRDVEVKILLTTFSIGGGSLTGLCCSAIYSTRYRILSVAGMVTSAVCLLLILVTIWINVELLKNGWKLLESLIVLSVSFAHVSVLLIQPSVNRYVSYLKTATISSICAVAMVLFFLISGVFEEEEYFYTVLGVFAILDVAGTIATVTLNRMRKPL
jgi:hypothetical protein